MTPEQIQQAIEGMLSVQRELQGSQLRFEVELGDLKQSVEDLRESQKQNLVAMDALLEHGKATDRRIEQLLGYSINRERDSLDIQQDILDLRHRVVALEQKLSGS
ncbi:MAG: hypothetical protein HC940_06400 [Acaryochloris sp. SU_5_25]|nr:hypothetical protein [Acaryochloris sp. SU_5_25]